MAILRSSDRLTAELGIPSPLPGRREKTAPSDEAPGQPTLRDDEFLLLADLIYQTMGVKINGQKKGLLISRLSKRLKFVQARSFFEYYKKVKKDENELREMLNCISTNTTEFFREQHHFFYLRDALLPELLRRDGQRTLRVWSAGCSTGEEPYSIAIAILECLRARHISPLSLDIKILATDISTKVLRSAEAGSYHPEQVPAAWSGAIAAYVRREDHQGKEQVRVIAPVKDMVRFRRLNLKDETYPFQRRFDAIFCRNVMIYFDEKMKQHVLARFHRHLLPGGHLFLGHSETMANRTEFTPVHTTVYRKS